MMRSLLYIAAALLPVTAMAQTNAKPIPDAPTADPQHYTVEFENADVRILRIKYPAHSKGNMHDHPHSVTVMLTGASCAGPGLMARATLPIQSKVWPSGKRQGHTRWKTLAMKISKPSALN
ncbi:hypothetical protein C7W88_09375 [Novosphingobium sp. THN1]|uniref:hypothetical protein n=1 Tax=Novosphingobium sp. THN1 TaxID=1016987 RepID=UPI000E47B380|nr:hypothetical protein [Novosphingobium sp. THN1]AXU19195.1 hypothetical protein C7W88_09375 [Novosphingobium sp. THN1]